MNLTAAKDNENERNTALAPCGEWVHVPIGSARGEWLHCEACGGEHRLIKTNGDGTPAKLADGG